MTSVTRLFTFAKPKARPLVGARPQVSGQPAQAPFTVPRFAAAVGTGGYQRPYFKGVSAPEQEPLKISPKVQNLDVFEVTAENAPDLDYWQNIIYEEAVKTEKLDPFKPKFLVVTRDKLVEYAARGGFPVRYSHWSFGQEQYKLQKNHAYYAMRIYEMVINTDPCLAYLQRMNSMVDQKLVMAHVMGHSDFFKNNVRFQDTDRKMDLVMRDHANMMARIQQRDKVGQKEWDEFLDMALSLDDLVDVTTNKPRPLEMSMIHPGQKIPAPLPEDWGKVDTTGMPAHLRDILFDPLKIQKAREAEQQRRKTDAGKVPSHPDNDVTAFVLEHSPVLQPWQRDVLAMLREETYYFQPQGQTKIFNEGWAVMTEQNLMSNPRIQKASEAIDYAHHRAQGLQNSARDPLNPYRIGIYILRDIEERYNKGQHGPEWEKIKDHNARAAYDDKSMKGREKLLELRKTHDDSMLIRDFLTLDLVNKIKFFPWQFKGTEGYEDRSVTEADFQAVKQQMAASLAYGRKPYLQVIDGNYNNNNELLLNHKYMYDLRMDWAFEVMQNLKTMWGKPVHMYTYLTDTKTPGNPLKRVRLSVQDGHGPGQVALKAVEIDNAGKVLREMVVGN